MPTPEFHTFSAALFAVNGGHQAMMVRIDDGKTLPFSAFTTLFLL